MRGNKLTLSAVILLLLSVSGWANDHMKVSVQIGTTVQLGSIQLAPGDYKMTWTENGSNAQVTFSQGNKVIFTVPAQVIRASSGYDGPVLHTNTVSNKLTGVELPKVSFSFTSENAVPATPSK